MQGYIERPEALDPMDARDLQLIDAFLADVGQASLLEYYGITPDTAAEEVAERVRTRRAWAQAQQANPKYRFQALWLIKNNALVQRVLVQELRAYAEALATRERDRKLQMLDLFVQGSLVSGRLSSEAEAAIRRQAHEMGLSEAETSRYLEGRVGLAEGDQESLFSAGPGRANEGDAPEALPDFYALLQISPQATAEEIEEAYRERYRWARTLKDLQKANEIYQQLEQAWRILSDTTRRREYDDGRRAALPEATPQIPAAPPVQVPRALRAAPQEPAPSDPGSTAVEDEDTVERPSEIRLGRPRWASDSRDEASDLSAQPPEFTDEASSPQPPAGMAARTFQPGTPEAPAKPRHTPQLRVQGPDQFTIPLWMGAQVRTVTVSNAGQGRLRGNVASSQPWLQVSPRTLHLKDEVQVIEIRAIPSRLPGHSGRARVTISTTHGERWAMTVDAYKRRVGAGVLAGVGLFALLVLALARLDLLPVAIPGITPVREHTVRTLLQLSIDPPTAHILLGGRKAGLGPVQLYEDPAVPGQPLELRVEAPNTQPYVETLLFVDGQRIRRNIRLVAGPDPSSWAEDPETGRRIITALAPLAPLTPASSGPAPTSGQVTPP